MTERLQKVLASAGVASRRQAELLIASGRVTVNGRVARLGEKVDPERDSIALDGQPVAGGNERLYIVLNKPAGYVTSTRSTHGELTVYDLPLPAGVLPVGRLDRETSGLLLMTNDGDWANLVTHPRYQVPKTYRATVQGDPRADDLKRLADGVELPDGTITAPARVTRLPGHNGRDARLLVTVTEGKKRQIRLMCAAIGYPVRTLQRIQIDGIELGNLAEGRWRALRASEVEGIRVYARGGSGQGSRLETAGRDRRPGRSR